MKNIIRMASIVGFVFLSACSQNTNMADVEYDQSVSPYHIVKRGDTIASVSKRYSMDRDELIRLNGLKKPYRIVIGQRLLVRATAGGKKTIRKTKVNDAEMPAIEPVNKGGVEIKALKPLPGTETPATEQRPTFVHPDGIEPAVDIPLPGMGANSNGKDESAVSQDSDYDAPSVNPDSEGPVSQEEPGEKPTKADMSSVPASEKTFRRPLKGTIISPFKKGKDGINIRAPLGTPVVAANNGVVAHAGNKVKGFGNVILVKHDNGMITVYAHLNELKVGRGDKVQAGQPIGTVGRSGDVSEPQLHFEIRKGKAAVDPEAYIG